MAKFVMFGKYSSEALKGISSDRTKKAAEVIKKFGGKFDAVYAILGKYDLLIIADFPSIQDVMKASVALSKMSGIGFKTCPAVPIEEFDRLMSEV